MKKALVVLVAFLLSACGGAPATYKQDSYLLNGQSLEEFLEEFMINQLGKDSYILAKEEFPDLHAGFIKEGWNALHEAFGHPHGVSYGVIGSKPYGDKTIIYLIPSEDTKNGNDSINVALLYYAMKKGDIGKAREIIKKGIPLNSKYNYETTLLHILFDDRHKMPNKLEMSRILLNAGADPETKDYYGNTSLHVLLDKKTKILDKQELMSILLEAGADPNALSDKGTSVLMAVLNSDIDDKMEALRKLLSYGADPDRVDKSGQTVLHEILSYAVKDDKDLDENTIIGWLDHLITSKTNLDARNEYGKTPLALAFLGDKKKIEKYLLDKGATDYGIKNTSYENSKVINTNILSLDPTEIYSLNKGQCNFILREYDVEFESLTDIDDVDMPVKLKSDVGGIKYSHIDKSDKFSIMDCRLVVALAGWAPVLNKYKVKEIVHMRAYSPKARVGGGTKVSGHSYALALDVARLIFKDSKELSIKEDWTDHRKVEPCTAQESSNETLSGKMLRSITCDTANANLFSVILTPHYNRAHYDHLHMEIEEYQYMFVQ